MKSLSIMVGTKQPKVMGEFYEKVFNRPADMTEGGWYGWDINGSWVTFGEHSEVGDKAQEPARMLLNFEHEDVKGEFDRIKEFAEVVKEPYEMGGGWIATMSDPDGNYFQFMSPWENNQG